MKVAASLAILSAFACAAFAAPTPTDMIDALRVVGYAMYETRISKNMKGQGGTR